MTVRGDFNCLSVLSAPLPNNLFSSVSPTWPTSSFPVSSTYMHLPPLSIGWIPRLPDYEFLSSTQSTLNTDALDAVASAYTYNYTTRVLAYKPVARKVRSVLAPVDEEFQVTWSLPDDPLARMIPLPTHPPDFIPRKRFIQERADALDLNLANWLWSDEVKLLHWIVRQQEMAFTWELLERGRMDPKYFPPVKIPTVHHTPWVLRNISIPPAMWTDTMQIIKDWIASRVYEPSTSAYQSRWFCILKQDGKSLCLVHDLQPLNVVTIRDSSTPPFVEHFAESFTRYAVYGMMDLFAGYDQRPLHPDSRDLTTFSSPMGPHCLTTVPMGYTNPVQIHIPI